MANELLLSVTVGFNKASAQLNKTLQNSITVAGDAYINSVVTVSHTSYTTITLGAVGTPGYVLVKNLDPTNFVKLSEDHSVYPTPMKVLPGEIWLGRWAASNIYILADTADCNIEISIIEA